jgi:hypothetical protein
MPNLLAHLALFGWPLVVAVMFLRLPLAAAVATSTIGGYLLLPEEPIFDLPMLPALGKSSISSLSAVVMTLIILGRRQPGAPGRQPELPPFVLPGWLPRSWLGRICLLLLVAGAFMTALTNGDRLVFPMRVLPGLTIYDAVSTTLGTLLGVLPFLLARKFLAYPETHKTLLLVICIAGLIYSLPTLYEVRMSPQLNRTFYGFFPHSWLQHIRGDGFRPLVFLRHGLELGIFLAFAVLSAAIWLRLSDRNLKLIWGAAIPWLLLTLVLAKTAGALIIAVVLLPVALFCRAKLQLLVAAAFAACVLLYPTLRSANIITADGLAGMVSVVSERENSLRFRLDNEDLLLDRAEERPLFGWGGWGRNRVYDEKGRDVSVTDGTWIVTFGTGGWTRYLGQFGLICGSLLLLAFRRDPVTLATSGVALLLAANLIDLLPNSSLSVITWLTAGALAGRIEITASDRAEAPAETEPGDTSDRRHALVYRRKFRTGPVRTASEPKGTRLSRFRPATADRNQEG